MFSWSITLALAAAMTVLIYVYLVLKNNYWKKRGIPCAKAEPFFGSTRRLFFIKESYPDALDKIYHQLEGHSFGGFYRMMTPCVLLRDPQLVRRILVKDFMHFHNRGYQGNKSIDPLAQHLFVLDGELWRQIRSHLSKAFGPGKTRRMFFLIEECCRRMTGGIEDALKGDPFRDFELKADLSRYTTDVIGLCAYGIECGAIGDANCQFRQIGRKIFEESYLDAFRKIFVFSLYGLANYLRIGYFPSSIMEFFSRIFEETVTYRMKNKLQRDDLIHLLMQLREGGQQKILEEEEIRDKVGFSDDLLISNAFLVFFVGFEMTSSAMCFCLFELALHPVIQNRVRHEVDAVLRRHSGQLTFEGLQEMTYLDKVVAETLRLYPPMGFLQRECTTPYEMPDGTLLLEQGITVSVPVLSLHRDGRNFEDPLEFRPDRFPAAASHPAYIPFGDGPRTCMGQVFAMAEVKAGLAAILSQYEVRRSPRSPPRPAPIEPRKIFTNPAGGLWLRVARRSWLPAD